MKLQVLSGQQAINSDLVEQIISFDRENMREVFEKAHLEFPVDKRRKGFESDPTIIVAWDRQSIAGYLQYLRSWNDPNYIYVGSVQIAKKYRNTELLLELVDKFTELVAGEEFCGFETSVQKVNTLAVRMYQKIGFKLESNPNNHASWIARAGKELLLNSPIIRLIEKWRERQTSRGTTLGLWTG